MHRHQTPLFLIVPAEPQSKEGASLPWEEPSSDACPPNPRLPIFPPLPGVCPQQTLSDS